MQFQKWKKSLWKPLVVIAFWTSIALAFGCSSLKLFSIFVFQKSFNMWNFKHILYIHTHTYMRKNFLKCKAISWHALETIWESCKNKWNIIATIIVITLIIRYKDWFVSVIKMWHQIVKNYADRCALRLLPLI